MSSNTPILSKLGISTSLPGALEQAPLEDKAGVFHRLEEAMAFERACSALERLAEAMSRHRWAKELHFRWRGSGHMSTPSLSLSVSAGDDPDLKRNDLTLAAVMDFTIAAGKLARGELQEKELKDLRQFADAARGAFILGSRQEGFDAESARGLKSDLELCESELSKAFVWADRRRLGWLDHGALDSHWSLTVGSFSNGKALAEALKMPALAAEMERRELALEIRANPEASAPRGPKNL